MHETLCQGVCSGTHAAINPWPGLGKPSGGRGGDSGLGQVWPFLNVSNAITAQPVLFIRAVTIGLDCILQTV